MSEDGNLARFNPLVPIEARKELLGDVQGAGAVETAAQGFVDFFNNNYARLASEWPVLHELSRLGALVSVANWFRDRGIPVEQGWLTELAADIRTPSTTQAVTAMWTGARGDTLVSVAAYGGVDFCVPNAYRQDDGRLSRLVEAAQRSRPENGSASWQFSHGGSQYQAWTYRYDAPVVLPRAALSCLKPAPARLPTVTWSRTPVQYAPVGTPGHEIRWNRNGC